MADEASQIVARAIARSGAYHRRNAIATGVVGLIACLLVVQLERVVVKGALLVFAAGLAIAAYRALRQANRYIEPRDSPVLFALVREPRRITVVRYEQSRQIVVVESDGGEHLDIMAPAQREGLDRLLNAFASVLPEADVRGRPESVHP